MNERNATSLPLKAIRFLLLLLLVALAVGSLLPIMESNRWWIRFLDFPRLQLTISLTIVLVLYAFLGGGSGTTLMTAIILATTALIYQGYRLYPYTPLVEPMAAEIEACSENARVRVMSANVQKSNRRAEEFLRVVKEARPDILLVMETNQWWDEQLATLHEEYPFSIQHIPVEAAYYGMHVLSRYPLIAPQVEFYFGADTPTIVSGVTLPTQGEVQFIGLHPRPPQSWARPTTMRDGHLAAAALAAASSDRPTILAGDFNAVPWERITRRAMRLGSLLDPRVGRGVYPTYDAQSWIMAWPLDQVLYQADFGLLRYEKLPAFGSDHYPILAELCHAPEIAERQVAPAVEKGDREEAQTAIEAARNLEN